MVSNGHKVSAPSAGAILLFFFMPWILASCAGQPVARFSGWQLAAGTDISDGFTTQHISGTPILFVVVAVALIVLGIVYNAAQRGTVTKGDSFALIGLAVFSLLVIFAQMASAQNDLAREGIDVEFQYGLWFTILGHIGVIAGGVWDLIFPPS